MTALDSKSSINDFLLAVNGLQQDMRTVVNYLINPVTILDPSDTRNTAVLA